MAVVSITEAAKLAGKSRQTMYRYIDNGRVSTTETPSGERGIETSELLRVFGMLHPLSQEEKEIVSPRNDSSQMDVTEDVTLVTVLKEQLERERVRADKAEAQAQELQKELVKTKDDMLELYNRLLPAATTIKEAKKGRLTRAVNALLGKD